MAMNSFRKHFSNEALQGVLPTGDMTSKCGDNLFSKQRQPTGTDIKSATICDSDKAFII